ncbi:MAG: CYTH domain-containing protein [candidate division Zixibacteria bacterium]|nr:CYTH domain-containing protein [candidate division Zixibacteria bacterium]
MTSDTLGKNEIEIKLQLGSFTNYLRLLGALGPLDGERQQLNAFFDTPNRTLALNGWALRVRIESSIADRQIHQTTSFVTLKSLPADASMTVVRQEIESEIDYTVGKSIVNGEKSILSLLADPVRTISRMFKLDSLIKIVEFSNTRLEKKYMIDGHEYLLEIDKTEYDDHSCDYELEIEIESTEESKPIIMTLEKLFRSHGIPFEHQVESKLVRALAKSGMLPS